MPKKSIGYCESCESKQLLAYDSEGPSWFCTVCGNWAQILTNAAIKTAADEKIKL